LSVIEGAFTAPHPGYARGERSRATIRRQNPRAIELGSPPPAPMAARCRRCDDSL
jgi:hypothetical protein